MRIVAVADTGLGGGTAATAHPDVPASRIVGIFDWPGTSVSGCRSVISDGAIDVEARDELPKEGSLKITGRDPRHGALQSGRRSHRELGAGVGVVDEEEAHERGQESKEGREWKRKRPRNGSAASGGAI